MVLWALSIASAGMTIYMWLASLVAWRRTWWTEWIHLSLTWTAIVAMGLIHLALVWSNNVDSLGGAAFITMLAGAFFLRPDKHLPGYERAADWLQFKHPDPDLRYPHPLGSEANPPADPTLPRGGLWVPHAPNPYRNPTRIIFLIGGVVMLLAIIKFVIDVFL